MIPKKVKKWLDACDALAKAKEEEANLRNELISENFPIETIGTNYRDLDEKHRLQCVFSMYYRLNADESTLKALEVIKKRGPEGEFIAKRLVKFTPELRLGEYKILDDIDKKTIDAVLTITRAQPSLKVVERKK